MPTEMMRNTDSAVAGGIKVYEGDTRRHKPRDKSNQRPKKNNPLRLEITFCKNIGCCDELGTYQNFIVN